jgi:hypothetical protein
LEKEDNWKYICVLPILGPHINIQNTKKKLKVGKKYALVGKI